MVPFSEAIPGKRDKINFSVSVQGSMPPLYTDIIDSRNISTPHELANILTREKILTTREKKGNLISLFDGFTLFHCVGMITFLIHYLRTPEEKVENIFMLYGADKNNKLRRRLIYDALGIIQSQQE